ncbi:MAG: MFS transporter [Colwellia sp.]|nr:MFS transporter [Colwellia sp.]
MLLILAILILSCAQLGSQIFLPALPEIAQYYSITNRYAQYIVMLYFISFGLSQLIYGPWSDKKGRRQVFLIGQAVYILGTILAVFSTSPLMFASARILQGLGAGSTLVISRTVLSDQLTGTKLNKAIASLSIAASLIAIISPLLGGWLSNISNWQGVFIMLSMHLSLVWWLGYKLLASRSNPELEGNTKILASKANSLKQVASEYVKLLTNFHFINVGLFKWLITLLFLTSVTFFPFEFQQNLQLTASQYGFYLSLATCGLIIGAVLAKLLQKRLGYKLILMVFWPLLLLSGLGLYFLPFTLITSMSCYFLFMVCAGAYYPCCLQLIIAPFRHKTCTVNALLGAIDMFVFSALAVLVNTLLIRDTHSLGILFLMVSAVLLISWLLIEQRERKLIIADKKTAFG